VGGAFKRSNLTLKTRLAPFREIELRPEIGLNNKNMIIMIEGLTGLKTGLKT
jgi:hypothetical protein